MADGDKPVDKPVEKPVEKPVDKKPEDGKEMTWRQFIKASKERTVCPLLRNTCVGPKCRMWLSAPDEVQKVEGAISSECAYVVQALCLSALVAMNAELTTQLGDLLSESADALEGGEEDEKGDGGGDSDIPIPDLSGGDDE